MRKTSIPILACILVSSLLAISCSTQNGSKTSSASGVSISLSPTPSLVASPASSPVLSSSDKTSLGANEVFYKGVSECKGLRMEVSFIYNNASSTIKNFKASMSCLKGKADPTNLYLSPNDDSVIAMVKKDGSIYNKAKSIKGKISLDKTAMGEITSTPGIGKPCDDGSYLFCTKWSASPEK